MDANWLLGLGEANGAFCVIASRTGDSYTVNGTYFVTDTYDFEEDDMKIIFPGLINDNMFKLHSAGVAQAYYVYGEMEIEYHFYIKEEEKELVYAAIYNISSYKRNCD